MSTTGFLKQNVSSFPVSDLLNQFVPQVLTLRNLEFVVLTVSLIRIFDVRCQKFTSWKWEKIAIRDLVRVKLSHFDYLVVAMKIEMEIEIETIFRLLKWKSRYLRWNSLKIIIVLQYTCNDIDNRCWQTEKKSIILVLLW